jgi:hypothetical protein
MKNALISPNESPVQYVSGWTTDTPPEPIFTPIENSCRVAEVEDQTFEVALPLFWTPCEDNVVADQFYYNTSEKEIYPVPEPAPVPKAQIPNS